MAEKDRERCVILANGAFPRKGSPARAILDHATRVVCCDGAADAYRRRTHREPMAVVGDCDSLKGAFRTVVRVAEQETNDLEKAIRFCRRNGWKNPVLLGVTGKRDDHTIGNIFRAMEHGLEIVTDYGHFVPLSRRTVLQTKIGSPVSIFAAPGTAMSSSGLAWPLAGVRFENFHCATLNRATSSRVTVRTTRKAYAFIAS